MTDITTLPNLQDSDLLLTELFEEVQKWEGTLSSRGELGRGAAAVQSLMETKVSFGNPNDKLILLTEKTFKEVGVELNSIYRQQMRDTYDFYYMTVTVDLRPKASAKFWCLFCKLEFSSRAGNEPIIQTIFPESKWRPVMKLGVGINLGVNENLEFSAGLDTSTFAELANIPDIKASVSTKNELKAFIAIPDYTYKGGFFELFAQGPGSSECFWRIEAPDIQQMPTVKFAIVFKVPKQCKSINLDGTVWAEANMDWLFADMHDVASEFKEKFKNLFKRKNEAAKELSRGDKKEWTLNLPK
ncbi:hypothetical protein NIES4071_56830 [Calothrix sp. NIES-4071]|nr:hypothetical protein NIES4071_56830 [Calothrix sp. NIES-4071]BAZ59990.1 hypothetical protein NIES4105_56780 [Calothrix sp. NIES-4105]